MKEQRSQIPDTINITTAKLIDEKLTSRPRLGGPRLFSPLNFSSALEIGGIFSSPLLFGVKHILGQVLECHKQRYQVARGEEEKVWPR